MQGNIAVFKIRINCLQGPHQVGKSGKSREFCDRSGKCREKQNTLKNVVVS